MWSRHVTSPGPGSPARSGWKTGIYGMLGGSDLQLHVESESPDIRHNSLDFSVCIFQLDLQPTTDSGILYQLCAMANGQTLMSVLPSIPTFPHKSSYDPDVLLDLDQMADLYEDSFRRGSQHDSLFGAEVEDGKITDHHVLG